MYSDHVQERRLYADGGNDRQKAHYFLEEPGLASPARADISPAVANVLTRYSPEHALLDPLETATRLGRDAVGLPISAAPIASLLGVAPPHGTSAIQDASRIALRLPAWCGRPPRAEARQGLDVSVARQQEITGRCTAVTKQRREVLSNPAWLERRGMDQAHHPVERIPRVTNRSKIMESLRYQMVIKKNSSRDESAKKGSVAMNAIFYTTRE